jgi:hypothetical protein
VSKTQKENKADPILWTDTENEQFKWPHSIQGETNKGDEIIQKRNIKNFRVNFDVINQTDSG